VRELARVASFAIRDPEVVAALGVLHPGEAMAHGSGGELRGVGRGEHLLEGERLLCGRDGCAQGKEEHGGSARRDVHAGIVAGERRETESREQATEVRGGAKKQRGLRRPRCFLFIDLCSAFSVL
jgi:hypothetical protein